MLEIQYEVRLYNIPTVKVAHYLGVVGLNGYSEIFKHFAISSSQRYSRVQRHSNVRSGRFDLLR